MKHLISILLFLLFSNQINAGQPALHILLNDLTCSAVESTTKADKWQSAPFIGILSHMAVDRVFDTSGIDYQYELSAIRPAIMLFSCPDEEMPYFLWKAFWALAPDLIDKNFRTNMFHQNDSGYFKLNPGQTNVSEELAILLFELRCDI